MLRKIRELRVPTRRNMLRPIKRRLGALAGTLSRRVVGPHSNAVLTHANGCQLLVEPYDMKVGRELRFRGSYGERELALIQSLVNPDSTVAFIGTHVGALAIPAAKWVRHAFFVEANPRVARLVASNCRLNGLDNVTLFDCAVGERAGEIEFIASRANSGGSKRKPARKRDAYYFDRPETLRVPLRRFDDLVGDREEDFDLIYMDVEGSEVFALRGMQKALGRTQALVVEFIGHHLRDVAQATVEDFLAPIRPHFDWLYVPSTDHHAPAGDFERVLDDMYRSGIDDDGIVFSRTRLKWDSTGG